MSDSNLSSRYQFVVTVSGKGGVGKSLLAQTAIELLILNQRSVETWQLDNQQQLEKTIGQSVKSLDIQTLKRSRKDPTVITKVFDPLFSGLETLPKTDATLLLDVGATQAGNLLDYAGLIDLDEELLLMNVRSLALVPCVAEPEAIRQAAKTLRVFEEVLPTFDLALVKNLRDGELTNLSTVSQAGQIFEAELLPFLDRIPQITMPLIEAGSWRAFEQNHCRFLEVGMMEIDDIRAMTGLSRPEAKLTRGDVLAFFALMEEELSPLFNFGEE
ncbi:P-loop NTPase family protein [Flexibacterium corallicola]|uniref:hypothetical protein n=1 Tax=Flexibacterium corallicola TaxID=3037259 RepID=UPI00286ED4C5|nr:hypothetical protein [Pseudovibrio sp. M1P-2-3]